MTTCHSSRVFCRRAGEVVEAAKGGRSVSAVIFYKNKRAGTKPAPACAWQCAAEISPSLVGTVLSMVWTYAEAGGRSWVPLSLGSGCNENPALSDFVTSEVAYDENRIHCGPVSAQLAMTGRACKCSASTLLQQRLNALPFGFGHGGNGETIAFLQNAHLCQLRLLA